MRETHQTLEIGRRGRRFGRYLLGFLLLLLLPAAATAQELSCPDCHNPNGIPAPHDTGCRNTPCSEACHTIGTGQLNHMTGPGTPAAASADRTIYCNSCHNVPWEGVYHPYTVNVLAGTPTIPGNVDLDQVCGQCHGGGVVQDALHQPRPPAQYRTKAALAPVAQGIHDSSWVSYPVSFSSSSSGLTLYANALVDCGGTCPPLTYDWVWGDGSQNLGAAAAASHAYPAGGTYTISLTVRANGLTAGAATGSVTVTLQDLPPVAAGICTWTEATWTMTVRDTSMDTDATPVQSVTVAWGDGSLNSNGGPGALFTHTYISPGAYTPTLKAVDTALKISDPLFACPTPATPTYYSIRGTVYRNDGTTPISSALVTLKLGATTVKNFSTGATGAFSFLSLKPGTYSLTVTRSGYNFGPAPQVPSVVVGPDRVGIAIKALSAATAMAVRTGVAPLPEPAPE